VDAALAQQVGREAQHVNIVVPAAHFGRHFVVTGSGANTGKLVGSDRHANAGPANEYATFRFVLGDLAADGGCDVGVIDALTVVRPLVADFVPPLLQQLNQLCLDVEAAMIAADGDTHIRSTSVKT